MRTALVSDLHLGAVSRSDVASEASPRARLMEAVSEVDRLVLLGDSLELRERPLAASIAVVRPFFGDLAEALAGRSVVIVPGNHDHALVEPWLTRLRLDGSHLGADNEWPVEPGDGVAGRLAELLPQISVSVAYPGLRVRPDVYAIHGHYLDLHLTVPRIESIAASAMGRLTGRADEIHGAGDYEAVLSPMYAFYESLAQAVRPATLARGGTMSRDVWARVTGEGRAGRVLLGRVTIPAGVAVLNQLGLGPFSSELSGEELRRSGLLAMGRVADALAPAGTEHVIFGHTHRPGPLTGDDLAEWTTLAGRRLWNTGSWFREPAFVGDSDRRSPYWPGTIVMLDDEGPPRLENPLRAL